MWMVKRGTADLMPPNPRFLPLVKQLADEMLLDPM